MTPETRDREIMLATIPKLRAFACSLCRNTDFADDLVQETLLRAWTNFALFKPGTNMAAWLFTILRNVFYSELRGKHRSFEPLDGHADRLASKPTQMAHAEFNDFHEAFGSLQPEQREALILIGASGLSYEEAAQVCGCAEGTIKSRVHRGRARLAELLFAEDEGAFGEDPITVAAIGNANRAAARA
jgi:RNA polymerase sigma-70 factor (ECF subfamily)